MVREHLDRTSRVPLKLHVALDSRLFPGEPSVSDDEARLPLAAVYCLAERKDKVDARTIQVSFSSRLENVELAGAVIHGLCAWTSMDERQCLEMELCAVEAMTNSIRHAYDGRPGHEVRIEVTVSPDRIVLRVEDDGSGIPFHARHARCPDLEPMEVGSLAEGGRGLLLIGFLMDEVELQAGTSTSAIVMTRSLRS